MIQVYWGIGREILKRQQLEGWGARVIDRLAADLKQRLPDHKGFSARNLTYMRAFADVWPDWAIVQRTVAQLPWRHQIALIEKLDSADLRAWYGARALESGWSRDVLAQKSWDKDSPSSAASSS